jgi:hypothetical protein
MRPLGALVRRGTEQPLRSASAATEQPNSFSVAGRRRSTLEIGTATRTDTDKHGPQAWAMVFPEPWLLKEQPLRSASAATEQPFKAEGARGVKETQTK